MSEAVIAKKGPYAVELEAGRAYAWCCCGRSQKQPFCDGSHKETTLEPLKFTAQEGGQAFLCGCKSTGSRPFCDGSHNQL